MKNFNNVKNTIVESVNKILEKHGLRIYDVSFITNSDFESDVLQILIEDSSCPNKPLDFDTLTIVNEEISNIMDEIDNDNQPYLLEVASAGIEKDIRSKEELIDAMEQYINVVFNKKLKDIIETNATLISFGDDEFEIEFFVKGQKKKTKFKWEDVSKVRYAVKF